MSRNGTTEERFWAKVDKNGPNGCWLWTGWSLEGYGRLTDEDVGKEVGAHRYSYKLHFKDPGSLNVCHSCDTTLCVNPAHLFAGTQKQNMEDMVSKGRQNKAKGEKCARSKITQQMANNIKTELAAGVLNPTEISKKLSVSRGIVYSIKYGETWK